MPVPTPKGFAPNQNVPLNWSGCKARIEPLLHWNPLKIGHFQSLNWILQCSDFGRADFLAWQFTWRVCPYRCCKTCQILQSICPAPDWPKLKIPKVLKISGNFSEFLHVRQYYKSQSLSEKQLNLYQVLTFFLNHTFKVFIYKACVGIQTLMLPASFCLSVLVYFKTVKSS